MKNSSMLFDGSNRFQLSYPSVDNGGRQKARYLLTCLTDQELNRKGLSVLSATSSMSKWFISPEFANNGLLGESTWLIHKPDSVFAGDGVTLVVPWWGEFEQRIDDLRCLAAEEDLVFSEASKLLALGFLEKVGASERPSAFLDEGGSIRLVWSDDGNQIALTFLPNKMIHYVLIRTLNGNLSPNTGRANEQTLIRIVSAIGLNALFYGG